jgi:hypothetical protein
MSQNPPDGAARLQALQKDAGDANAGALVIETRLARVAKLESIGAAAADTFLGFLKLAIPFVPELAPYAGALITMLDAGQEAMDASLAAQGVTIPATALDKIKALASGQLGTLVPAAVAKLNIDPALAAAAMPGLVAGAQSATADALSALAKKIAGA